MSDKHKESLSLTNEVEGDIDFELDSQLSDQIYLDENDEFDLEENNNNFQ